MKKDEGVKELQRMAIKAYINKDITKEELITEYFNNNIGELQWRIYEMQQDEDIKIEL